MYLNYLLKYKTKVEKAEFLSYLSYDGEEVIENERSLAENLHHTYILCKFLVLRRVEQIEIFESFVPAIIIEILRASIEHVNAICNFQSARVWCILVVFIICSHPFHRENNFF